MKNQSHFNIIYISVILCVYNGEKVLEAAIQSLLSQNYSEGKFEIILVDDGSVDVSRSICEKFIKERKGVGPQITYFFKKNSGLSSARNTGVIFAKGEILAFIDQDALADKDWLLEIENTFIHDKELGVIGGKIKLLNNGSWFATFIHWIHYYMQDKMGNEIIPIIGTNMAFRKEVFEKVGGFFEEFKSRGDENSFIDIKVISFFKKGEAKEALVYHERPDNFRIWLKERFYNGHEYALIYHTLRSRQKIILKKILYVGFRMLCFLFPFLFSIGIFCKIPELLFFGIVSLFCFIYRSFWRDNIFIKAKILKREYGVLKTILLLPLGMLIIAVGKFNDDYGFLRGLWTHRKIKVSDKISGCKIEVLESNIEK